MLTDIDQERVDKGVGYVHGEIDKLLAKGRVNHDQANRLKALVTGSLDKAEAFADADFVIEAVFEEIGVKQQVFAEVEAVVSAETILATNTSSLSVTEMASELKHPERVVGFHFFNPVAVLPLLEIVRGEQTDDASLATAFAVAKKLKKTAVLVKDAPGVRRQPHPDPLHGRDPERHRRGHPGRRRRAGHRAAGPADVAARAARTGRPGDRPARLGDPARRLPGPLHGLAEPRARRRGRQARLLPLRLRQAGAGPRGRRAAAAGRHRPDRGAGARPGAGRGGAGDRPDAGRGRRRRGRRTSTCA